MTPDNHPQDDRLTGFEPTEERPMRGDWLPEFKDVSMSWAIQSDQAERLAKLLIPPYRPIRWWHARRRLLDHWQSKRLLRELTKAMMEPIDPDEPNRSCFQ